MASHDEDVTTAAPASRSSARSPRRTFWVVAVGVLLLELAWIIALPAFRGMDETEHVFRADSLVHGQLLSREAAPHGAGQLVEVRSGVARAARSQCEHDYDEPEVCDPRRAATQDGLVVRTTTAGSYDPLWYAVVGTVALPFDGAAADVAMRAVTALLLALLVGWAAALVSRWDRSGWMLVGLLVAFTPIVAFSGAIAAPNAVGYGAALLLWAAVVSLLAEPDRPPLVALVVAAATVAHTHTTGVLWLAVAAVALLVLRPPRWWLGWLRARPLSRGAAVSLVLLAGVTAFAWVRLAGTNTLSEPDPGAGRPSVPAVVGQVLVWLLQTIGAFPNRQTPAPLPVYVLWLVPVVLLAVLAARHSTRAQRLALAWLAACWVAVPVVLTLVSYRSEGFAWQGRYSLPLVDGIVLLGAAAATRAPRIPRATAVTLVVATAVAHALSAAKVAGSEAGQGLGYAVTDHLPHAPAVVLVLALAGALAPLALLPPRRGAAAGMPTTATTGGHFGQSG